MAENKVTKMSVNLAKKLSQNKDVYLTEEGRKRLDQILKKKSWEIK